MVQGPTHAPRRSGAPAAGTSQTTTASPATAQPPTETKRPTRPPRAAEITPQQAAQLGSTSKNPSLRTPAELRVAADAAFGAKDLAEAQEKGARLPALVDDIVRADVAEVLGANPQEMLAKFGVASDGVHGSHAASGKHNKQLEGAWAKSQTLLTELTARTLNPVISGDLDALDFQRLSQGHQQAVVAQHAGYVAGVLARNTKLHGIHPIARETARILMREYFNGELRPTRGGDETKGPREVLADELARLSDHPAAMRKFVLSKDNDWMFDPAVALGRSAVLSNLAAVHAGEATLELAAQLVGPEKAPSFVKHVFQRPPSDLLQMLGDPHGPEGILLHFAATAHHVAWEAAKLADATLDAQAGNEAAAVKKWNHADLGSSRDLLVDKPDSALKVSDQIGSFLINRGDLVPVDRGDEGDMGLQFMLEQIAKDGIYTDPTERVLSQFATTTQRQLAAEVQGDARGSVWQVGAELASNTVAYTTAAYAAQATGQTDFDNRDRLNGVFHGAIEGLRDEIDPLLDKHGGPNKGDKVYRAIYEDRAGEVSFKALEGTLGVKAREVTRQATFGDLIPLAVKNLQLAPSAEFTPKNLVADLEALSSTLLQKDYFLTKPGMLEQLSAEAAKGKSHVKSEDLELAVRLPNATWMWLLLIRGLVEERKDRFEGAQKPDLKSDTFPDSVQFNPPDVRDVELFRWARHRLTVAHGVPPRDAERMALALVVFTQYKDLLQIRKGADL